MDLDDKLIERAKEYALLAFDDTLRGVKVDRHHQNNATRIVGFVLKARDELSDKDAAPLFGKVLEELKQSGELRLAD